MRFERLPFLLGLIPLLTGCGTKVTLELKNATSTSGSSIVYQEPMKMMSGTDQTSTVTIDSLKIPIADVGLSYADELYGTANSGYLYSCTAGTNAGCQVELVGTALQNLLTGGTNTGTLESGKTYASVMIGTCVESSNLNSSTYTVQLKAKATLNSTTYYTKTGSKYLTTTEADYSPVEITFSGCRNYTVFSQPFTYDGSAVTVNLYTDLRNIAHVFAANSTMYSSGNTMNCSLPSGETPSTNPYICLEYPHVGGTIKSGSPTIERYKLVNAADTAKVPEIIGFFFDADGQPIGGYNRAYIGAITNQTGFLTAPSGFKKAKLESGNLYFSDYSGGSTITNLASTQGDFTVKAFPRPAVNASSSITTKYDKNDASATVNYTVTRID